MHIPTQIANNSSHCNLIVLSAFQHIETHCADALSTLEVGPLETIICCYMFEY